MAELLVSAHHDVGPAAGRAAVVAEAVNRARDLQNTPANHMTPSQPGRAAPSRSPGSRRT